jgi:hypothetical protein
MPAKFDPSCCIEFDLEVYPGHWCVGFHGIDHAGLLSTKIAETRDDLKRFLGQFARQGRTLVSYNGDRFDVPLIRLILKGIDPYAPAQLIIRENRLPPELANAKLPEFPCDHVDLSARLRRGGSFPSLKVVAANLGRPILKELPFEPGAELTDEQWEEVKRYNEVDLAHTWALLQRLAPELQALAVLSEEQGQDLRSVSTPQVVERVFLSEYRKVHGRDPIRVSPPSEVRYRPPVGVVRPRTWDAADWLDRIVHKPIPMITRGDRKVPGVPTARFKIGKLNVRVGAGGLHSIDSPWVYYATRKYQLISIDMASFYPTLIDTKGIGPAGYGDTGRETYRSILQRRLRIKADAKTTDDPAERERLEVQASGLKLIINSFFGKMGDPYSTLYDPGAVLSVTLSGQLMLIDLIERLTQAKIRVISANTDGLYLLVPRNHKSWRKVLKKWETDTGMRLEVEPLKRLVILATNQYATRDAKNRVKRKGSKLRGALDWTHSPNFLVHNDAVISSLLFDVPPERTIFECRELVRFCSITKRSGKATSMVLVEGDTETELPRVSRWYRSKDRPRRIESRFEGGRHTTPAGAREVTICQDLPTGGLPDDLDLTWYLDQARRKIQTVPGYRHRSERRLLDHAPALEIHRAGLVPIPKLGEEQLPGSDVKHPTLLWDWPSYPTLGCYTGPVAKTLVVEVVEQAKFKEFVDCNDDPRVSDRWETLAGGMVSFNADATADGVRQGRDGGKFIFAFDGGPDHPLCRVGSRWKRSRGIEVVCGNGFPTIWGEYGEDGDQFRLEGTLSQGPDWLVESLTLKQPKQMRCRESVPIVSPAAQQASETVSGARPSVEHQEQDDDDSKRIEVIPQPDPPQDPRPSRIVRQYTTLNPSHAWALRRLLIGHDLNGELDTLAEPWKRMGEHLAGLDKKARQVAWHAMLAARPEAAELVKALADVDPLGPAPTIAAVEPFATLADVARIVSAQPWLWQGWLALGVLNALAADPGIGKTRLAMDLARRLWLGLPLPDGQLSNLPAGTRTLWVQGDRNFAEMLQAARDFGLPDEAVVLGSAPDEPFGSLDLDDPDTLAAIGERIQAASVPLAMIDTVGMTTSRNLSRPDEAREFFAPILELCQKTGVALLGLTHLSKDKEALGRRIVEKARVVIKLTQPDPDGQPDRRRLWVDKTSVLRPPALGITMGTTGNEYDFNPPREPDPLPRKRGPVPVKQEACKKWLANYLTPNPAMVKDVRTHAEAAGFSADTLYKAKDAIGVEEYPQHGFKWWKLPLVEDVGDKPPANSDNPDNAF